jgi:hypothetical protein
MFESAGWGYTIHFPNGEREYRFGRERQVGEHLSAFGAKWVVVRVTEYVCEVESDGAGTGPSTAAA